MNLISSALAQALLMVLSPSLKRRLAACVLASVLLPTAAAQAATYYVSTTGNNSNPGTEAKPWRTVAYAVKLMVAGDTTYVRGGLYNETSVHFSRSGTKTAPIKLLNYPGESPIIDFGVNFTNRLIQRITLYVPGVTLTKMYWPAALVHD
jgi:hypothetical protein